VKKLKLREWTVDARTATAMSAMGPKTAPTITPVETAAVLADGEEEDLVECYHNCSVITQCNVRVFHTGDAGGEGGEHLGGGRLQSDFKQKPAYSIPAALHKVQAQ
jgi:hypothetical protein